MANNRPDRRKREISIRVNDDEIKQLHERCGEMTLAKFLRNLGLGAPAIKKVDASFIRALGRIGSNLNQVARHANIEGELDRDVLTEIIAIRKILNELIEKNLQSESDDAG